MQKIIYKRNAVIVPYCMLAPGFQANAHIETKHGWNSEFVKMLVENQIDIIPYTCVEASFDTVSKGLLRSKHGLDYYESSSQFLAYCKSVAKLEAEKIISMISSGYKIIAILGIEHSPSCAVSYLYTHKGTLKRAGIFMDLLMDNLESYNLKMNYIGINKKFPNKAICRLRNSIL